MRPVSLLSLLLGSFLAAAPAFGATTGLAPFSWLSTGPLISPIPDATHPIISMKDPTVVYYNGKWQVIATTANTSGSWSMAYISFRTWAEAGNAQPYYLDQTPGLSGYHCAPQVFFFRPQNKWYLIYQSQPPSYSTTDDIEQPATWTAPKYFFSGTPASVVQGWIDFWIICDDTNAYLFFSDDNGRYYRSSTTLADFPNGFSDPVVIMQDPNPFNLFEGSCVYRMKGLNEYLCFIECIGPTGHRFFRAFTAGALDGDWTPLDQASSWDTPFAGANNVTAAAGGTLWTADISHGEMLRDTNDETMTIDPDNLYFLYQGADRNAPAASDYSQIPWQLALLQSTHVTQSPDTPPTQVIGASLPANTSVAFGGGTTLSATPTGGGPFTYQWQHNGLALAGATEASLSLANIGSADAGYYTVAMSDGAESTVSAPAVLDVPIPGKVAGGAYEFASDIVHPNGNVYDQVLLTGQTASVTADPRQIVRTSYIDANDDIVQIEFTGAGTLSVQLFGASGPALPVNYSQDVSYMKGTAGIVITGADETTNLSIFTVGRATAFDPTGAYNFLQPISAANDPANNGSPLFAGHADTAYDGFADVAYVAIASTDGYFGGLRAANASFSATAGITGVYAPGVQFEGPVFVHDIAAYDTARPMLLFKSAADTRITGGSLYQANGMPVAVDGIVQLTFTAGASSEGTIAPAQTNLAVLARYGLDVTGAIVAAP